MNRLAILLVHGFSGGVRDLLPLAVRLKTAFGDDCVRLTSLPGHISGAGPSRFDPEVLLAALSAELMQLRQSTDTLVVMGHSTGGNLALAALQRAAVVPDLLILAAAPFKIDLACLERWQRHNQGCGDLSLTTLAGLVKFINDFSERGERPPCPAILVQGALDRLVLPQDALLWKAHLVDAARLLSLPTCSHQLFSETGGESAVELLTQEITAILTDREALLSSFAGSLAEVEPESASFIEDRPAQLRHLAMCPSGQKLLGLPPALPEVVPWGPVFANIEITTLCNFSCRHCARTIQQPVEEIMPIERFESLLDRLPSAYRVTLVGLGEPLLHPQLDEFIALAKARGRRVGLVTNAQLLTEQRAAEIVAGGLDSIVFSLDAAEQALLSELREGSDLAAIERGIRNFCCQAENAARPISRAVFAAVSGASLNGLENLINKVSGFGVHVLMLSDLNFSCNREASLSLHVDPVLGQQIRRVIAHSLSRGLPVLGVRALEDFGLAHRYREALLLPVQQLYRRSLQHRHCASPWQTLSINVAGEICSCDCRPEQTLGSLLQQNLASIWNGAAMRELRRSMRSAGPPAECLLCPRF
jgi:MoaA/NifB/PqqE/SkfB family radical SAM enzyme/pimeloyl-ACP methyl ester carboxylesterase